jgi:hypothetical protein
MSLQIASTVRSSLWDDQEEIVINHKCRLVSNYQSRNPYTNRIKCGRITDFITFKYINKEKGIKMPLSGIKCWKINSS